LNSQLYSLKCEDAAEKAGQNRYPEPKKRRANKNERERRAERKRGDSHVNVMNAKARGYLLAPHPKPEKRNEKRKEKENMRALRAQMRALASYR
jgi:hypothetical protein